MLRSAPPAPDVRPPVADPGASAATAQRVVRRRRRPGPGPATGRAIALLLALCAGGTAWAQVPGTAAAPRLGEGARPATGMVWSVFGTYGFNQVINGSAAHIDIGTAGLRWSRLWRERLGGFLRGHPAVAVELLPLIAFVGRNRRTLAAGANLVYEHHFAAHGRLLPVWRIGAGFLYANAPVPVRETRHNFSLLTGLGVDILVSERSAVSVGYRFHHVSNANTGNINPGINTHAIVFGMAFYR